MNRLQIKQINEVKSLISEDMKYVEEQYAKYGKGETLYGFSISQHFNRRLAEYNDELEMLLESIAEKDG